MQLRPTCASGPAGGGGLFYILAVSFFGPTGKFLVLCTTIIIMRPEKTDVLCYISLYYECTAVILIVVATEVVSLIVAYRVEVLLQVSNATRGVIILGGVSAVTKRPLSSFQSISFRRDGGGGRERGRGRGQEGGALLKLLPARYHGLHCHDACLQIVSS